MIFNEKSAFSLASVNNVRNEMSFITAFMYMRSFHRTENATRATGEIALANIASMQIIGYTFRAERNYF